MKSYLIAGLLLFAPFASEADAVVTIANPNSPNTTVTFDTPGVYVFRGTASDGVKSTVITTTITVNSTLPKISGGTSNAIAGNGVDFGVFLATGTSSVASLQFDLMLPAGLTAPVVTAGPAILAAGKSVASAPITGGVRIIISGLNQTPIQTGQLVSVNLRLDSALATGTQTIGVTGIVASDALGIAVASLGVNGTVGVTANKAPIVTVGANQTITLPNTANLTATMTDDNSPCPPCALTWTWERI